MKVITGRLRALLVPLVACLVLMAHIGTNDVVMDGMAGPYPLRVVVRPAGVVPGRAQVSVRVLAGDVTAVTLQSAPAKLGSSGAPRPDTAAAVKGETGLFAGEVWLMTTGAYVVNVGVSGRQGDGTLQVPVTSAASRRLTMNAPLAVMLTGLATLLVVGLLAIVRAAKAEAVLPPGAQPEAADRRRGRRAMAVASVVALVALGGGYRWWSAEDAAYRRTLRDAALGQASIADGSTLRFELTGEHWKAAGASEFVPDHGRIAHLFLVRDESLDAFADLHPTRSSARIFETRLPPLPAGAYHAFLEVVDGSGRSWTVVAPLSVRDSVAAATSLDPDDGFTVSSPIANSPSASGNLTVSLAGGGSMTWERAGSLTAGPELTIRVSVRDADGKPAVLEPYLGTAGHAVVMRRDRGVFVHVHPGGMVSAAAESLAAARWNNASAMTHASIAGDGVVRFPFALPTEGTYRVWVQVRMKGRVETGVFDTAVQPRAR